ncbi:MAG: CAP domain-containing protein [Chitinophagaceae bacterium]|nr:CAP domain-containing protein [Chitinophagaceae bacterium]
MKRILSVFIALCFINFVHAQGSIVLRDAPFIIEAEKDLVLQQWLDSNAVYNKLSTDQQESIYWLNYVRKYPKLFHHKILVPFLEQFPEVKSAYSKSLSATLLSMTSVGLLIPDEKLTKVAAEHATDLGKHGASISHNATSGSSFQERMNKAGYFGNVAENIYEGKRSSLEALIFLLIDAGVRNVGHRKNILSNEMKRVGVSFFAIKNRPDMFFLVQDFSGE